MENRKQESKRDIQNLPEIEINLLEPKTPDLSLRRKDHTVAFKLPHPHRKDSEADDLPDITPELMAKLNALWGLEDAVEDRPIHVLVRAVREHLDAINPYIEILKDDQRSWYECWQFLYKIAQNLDHAAEEQMNIRFYSVPESLRLMELRARSNLGKDETEWEKAKIEYTIEFDKRREKIVELAAKVKEIADAKDLTALIKYDVSLREPPVVQQPAKRKPGCLSFLYVLFAPKQAPQPSTTEKTNTDEQSFQNLREKLLKRYQDELTFQTNNLNEFGEAAPKKSDKYSSEWKEIKAKILHNQIDFYRDQSKEVMLHCIRLYTLAVRTYYLIYGENPVADAKTFPMNDQKRIKQILDDQDKLVNKAKDCFKQMIKGLKSHLGLFYCLQPDRCEFSKYLSNYVNIPQQEARDAILAGNAPEEIMEKVFPEFEAPEEAFQVSPPVM